VRQHLGLFVADKQRLEVVVNKSVGRLRPLQDDIGPMFGVVSKEAPVQPLAFLRQHTHGNLYTSLSQHIHPPAVYFGKGIDTTYYHPPYTFFDNQFRTGRSLPVVSTGFQRHVDSSVAQQVLVLVAHTGKGIHLSVSLTAAHVVALADNTSVCYYHSPHHGVGTCSLDSVGCQLEAATHIGFIIHHSCKFTHFLRDNLHLPFFFVPLPPEIYRKSL